MAKIRPKIIGDRRWIRYLTVVFGLLGLVVSGYAYYVEVQLSRDKQYKPTCDINSFLRCSSALTSKYAIGFGFLGSVFGQQHLLNQPNTFYGMVFYALMACLGYARNSKASLVQLNLAFISVLVSAYLAYVLVFLLDEICPVCISTYVINLVLLLLSIFKGKPRIAEHVDGKVPRSSGGVKEKSAGKEKDGLLPNLASGTGRSYAQVAKEKKRN